MGSRSWRAPQVAFVLLLGVRLAHGGTAAEFGATQFPGQPRLVRSLESALCGQALVALTTAHRGHDVIVDGPQVIFDAFSKVETQEIPPAADSRPGTQLQRVDLDLDGTGTLQTVVLRTNPFNWSGDWHYAHVFPSPASFEANKDAYLGFDDSQGDQYPSADKRVFGARSFFPSALGADGKSVNTGNVWAQPQWSTFSGRYYFAHAANHHDIQHPIGLAIFRLRAAGTVETVCEFSQAAITERDADFRQLDDVEALLVAIRRIGDPGPDSGTLHAEFRHLTWARWNEQMAAARPWVLTGRRESGTDGDEAAQFAERFDEFLEQWSLAEPWTRRELQTMRALMPTAVRSYAVYLQREFGLSPPDALASASTVLTGVLHRHVQVPSSFGEFRVHEDALSEIRAAIVARNTTAFEAYLAGVAGQPDAKEIYSQLLPVAVEWPSAFDRLLALGADPNFANEYGKTPLMVAAHLNRSDAVRKLLKAGADVNARTPRTDAWGYNISRVGRTPLTYALENAGPTVITLLLEAGAVPEATTGTRGSVGSDLAQNPRFTPEDVERLGADLKGLVRRDGASFHCKRARADVERAICGSEVLRVLDREIADAFARLKTRRDASLVTEQREWLRERDRRCGAPVDTDCLAEWMRTRARALHLRWTETGTAALSL